MNKIFINVLILFLLTTNQTMSEENIMILKLKDGDVKIELFEDIAPNHVKRIKELANNIIKRLEETTGLDIRASGFPAQIVDDEPEEIGYEVTIYIF